MISMLKNGHSAFIVDSSKVDLFLNEKSSKQDNKMIKDRTRKLQKILKDNTTKKNIKSIKQ